MAFRWITRAVGRAETAERKGDGVAVFASAAEAEAIAALATETCSVGRTYEAVPTCTVGSEWGVTEDGWAVQVWSASGDFVTYI